LPGRRNPTTVTLPLGEKRNKCTAVRGKGKNLRKDGFRPPKKGWGEKQNDYTTRYEKGFVAVSAARKDPGRREGESHPGEIMVE